MFQRKSQRDTSIKKNVIGYMNKRPTSPLSITQLRHECIQTDLKKQQLMQERKAELCILLEEVHHRQQTAHRRNCDLLRDFHKLERELSLLTSKTDRFKKERNICKKKFQKFHDENFSSDYLVPHNTYISKEDHTNIMQFKDLPSRSCDEIYMCPLITRPTPCSWHSHIHQQFRLHQNLCQGLKGYCNHTAMPNCRCIMYPFLTEHCGSQEQDGLNVPDPMEALLKKTKQSINSLARYEDFSTVYNPMCTDIDSTNDGHQQNAEEEMHRGLKINDRLSSQKVSGVNMECRGLETQKLFLKEQDVTNSQERILKDECVYQQCVYRKAGKQHLEEVSVIAEPSSKSHHQSCISTETSSYYISAQPQQLPHPVDYHVSDNLPVTNKEKNQHYFTGENCYLFKKTVHEETSEGVNHAQILHYNDCSCTECGMKINLNTETADVYERNGMGYNSEKKDEFISLPKVETKIKYEKTPLSEKIIFDESIQAEVAECGRVARLPMKHIEKYKNHDEDDDECDKSVEIKERETGNSKQEDTDRITTGRTQKELSHRSSGMLDNDIIPEDSKVHSEINVAFDVDAKNLQVKDDLGNAKLDEVVEANVKNVMEKISKQGTLNEDSESEDREEDTIPKELWTGKQTPTDITTRENDVAIQRWAADMQIHCHETECNELNSEGYNDDEEAEDEVKDGTECSDNAENEIRKTMAIRKNENEVCTSNKETNEEVLETTGECNILSVEENKMVIHYNKKRHGAKKDIFNKSIEKEFKFPCVVKTRKYEENDLQVEQEVEQDSELFIDDEEEEEDEESVELSEGDKSLSVDQETEEASEDSEENTDFWGSKDDLSISQCEGEQEDKQSQPGGEFSQIKDENDFCRSIEESAHLQESVVVQGEQTDVENKRQHEVLEKKCSEDCAMVGLQMSPLETGALYPTQEPLLESPTSNADAEHVPKTSCEDSMEDLPESDNESKMQLGSDAEDNVHDFFD